MDERDDPEVGELLRAHEPEERTAEVSSALATLLALAETLDELELDGVAPALGAPRWR